MLKFIKFSKETKESRNKLEETVKEIVPSLGYNLKFVKLQDMDEITKMSLLEKHLVSPNFVMNN